MRWAHSYPEIPDGARDHFIFCAAISLAWSVDTEMLPSSIMGFAREAGLLDIPSWSPQRVEQVTSSVVRRARSEAREGGSSQYKQRRASIIELLGITPAQAEDLDLTQLDPSDERRKQRSIEANRQRQEKHRRQQGSMPREDYLAGSLARSRPWEALDISRSAWYKRGLHRQPLPHTRRLKSAA